MEVDCPRIGVVVGTISFALSSVISNLVRGIVSTKRRPVNVITGRSTGKGLLFGGQSIGARSVGALIGGSGAVSCEC